MTKVYPAAVKANTQQARAKKIATNTIFFQPSKKSIELGIKNCQAITYSILFFIYLMGQLSAGAAKKGLRVWKIYIFSIFMASLLGHEIIRRPFTTY